MTDQRQTDQTAVDSSVCLLRQTLEKANEAGDYKTALHAQREINRILGLHKRGDQEGEGSTAGGVVVNRYQDVAEFFGCSKPVVLDWMKAGMPHKPRYYDLGQVAKWVWERTRAKRMADEKTREAAQRKMIADADRSELRTKEKQRELVSRKEMEELLRDLAAELAEKLEQIPEDPSLDPRQKKALREKIGAMLDDFRSRGSRGIDRKFSPPADAG